MAEKAEKKTTEKKTEKVEKKVEKTEKKTEKTETPVPEVLLKKRKSNQERLAEAKKRKQEKKKEFRAKKRIIFKKAEQYIKEYRQRERSLINFRRAAKQGGNFYVEPEPKLLLVIRIRGINGLHPKPRKILQLFRLRQINNAVFVRVNKAVSEMLKLIEPYVTFGSPNLKTVRELIYKRGFAKVGGQRVSISSNSQIEKSLGKNGLICIEDLIHEIFTVGPNFKWANRFLWPFKLNPPRGGWNKINVHYNQGGDFGNREEKISELAQRMN